MIKLISDCQLVNYDLTTGSQVIIHAEEIHGFYRSSLPQWNGYVVRTEKQEMQKDFCGEDSRKS